MIEIYFLFCHFIYHFTTTPPLGTMPFAISPPISKNISLVITLETLSLCHTPFSLTSPFRSSISIIPTLFSFDQINSKA